MNIKTLVCLSLIAVAAVTSCTHQAQNAVPQAATVPTSAKAPTKVEMIQRILSLPAYALHEETVENFRKRLENGRYEVKKDGAAILGIRGDGVCGNRVFRMTGDGELFIQVKDWENTEYDEKGNPVKYVYSYSRVAPGSTDIQYTPAAQLPPESYMPDGTPARTLRNPIIPNKIQATENAEG